jgi:hypothetical protein
MCELYKKYQMRLFVFVKSKGCSGKYSQIVMSKESLNLKSDSRNQFSNDHNQKQCEKEEIKQRKR